MQTLKNKFFFYPDINDVQIKAGSVEHAYLLILCDDLINAKKNFQKQDSPRAQWGYLFCCILGGYLEKYPTYFQLRNFLEIDLDFLIKNEKLDYIEQVLGALNLLVPINQEVFKFVARVMFENKLYSLAGKYLEMSKNIYYNDPELHFLYAKYYLMMHDVEKAYFFINECLKILPNYYPANVLKTKIEENSF